MHLRAGNHGATAAAKSFTVAVMAAAMVAQLLWIFARDDRAALPLRRARRADARRFASRRLPRSCRQRNARTTRSARAMAKRPTRTNTETEIFLAVGRPAEQLHAVAADLHSVLGGELAGERGLARVRLALLGTRGGAQCREPGALEFDADVGDLERDRLPVTDRLAERLALVDVRDDVVEDGLAGAARERRPRDAREPDALGEVGVAAWPTPARARSRARSRPTPAARSPIAGSDSIDDPARPGLERNRVGAPSSAAATTNSSASAARGTSDFTPSRTKPSAVAACGRLQRERVEQRRGVRGCSARRPARRHR